MPEHNQPMTQLIQQQIEELTMKFRGVFSFYCAEEKGLPVDEMIEAFTELITQALETSAEEAVKEARAKWQAEAQKQITGLVIDAQDEVISLPFLNE